MPAFSSYAADLPLNAPCVVANGAAIYDYRTNEALYTVLAAASEAAGAPSGWAGLFTTRENVSEMLSMGPVWAGGLWTDDMRLGAEPWCPDRHGNVRILPGLRAGNGNGRCNRR